tara:strand:- start:1387 stop:1971 length:585 start_codon:yes stop_codon:yes gene_type:complete
MKTPIDISMRMPPKKAKVNYVDNKQLYVAMTEFTNLCREAAAVGEHRPKVPEYIGLCIFRIATRLATKPNFASYTYKDEMISDGIEVCIRYLHNFDPQKSSNPFAYFTQIIYYAFLQRIQKEKKQQYIKNKSFENSVMMNTLVDDPTGKYFDTHHAIDSNKTADFEDKLAKAKIKSKKKTKLVGIEAIIGDVDE